MKKTLKKKGFKTGLGPAGPIFFGLKIYLTKHTLMPFSFIFIPLCFDI